MAKPVPKTKNPKAGGDPLMPMEQQIQIGNVLSNMRFFIRIIMILVATDSLAACYDKRVDLAPGRNADQVAALDCWGGQCGGITNLSTNETRDLRNKNHFIIMERVGLVLIEPGQYLVEVITFGARYPGQRNEYRWFGPFIFKEGHRYKVTSTAGGGAEIRDVNTGEILEAPPY